MRLLKKLMMFLVTEMVRHCLVSAYVYKPSGTSSTLATLGIL